MKPGTRISHYRIVDQLGRGGMGIVYKAEDTKLDRIVALKVLPAAALASEDDRARFYREAKAAAALHHPNIATIFGIDEGQVDDGAESQPFIAMEFVDGQTLAGRIAHGPLPIRDGVSIAVQIAEGLKAAHAKGIVHRDIKSGNVMLREDGRAKILDFGLAMTAASTRLTQLGSTLGTAAYMSPEQARGEEVDPRTDLWSLAVVLYEMVTGRLPFPGDYEQAIVYGILNAVPEPVTGLRTGVPMELERIVTKLLAKDRSRRYQNAADLVVDLESVDIEASRVSSVGVVSKTGVAATALSPPAERSRFRWLWVPVALVLFLAGLAAGRILQSPDNQIPVEGLEGFAVSPDGESVAYSAGGALWLRLLSDLNHRRLVDSIGVENPFWSPGGDQIGFVAGGKLSRIDATGGAAVEICEIPFGGFLNAVWTADGTIYFLVVTGGATSEVFAVPEQGGSPRSFLRSSEDSGVYTYLDIGPMKGGRSFILSKLSSDDDAPRVDFVTISADGSARSLLSVESRDAVYPAYSPTGHIVYATGGAIWAISLTDSDRSVVQPLRIETGAGRPSISESGTLVYQGVTSGISRAPTIPSSQVSTRQTELLLVDRIGNTVASIGTADGGSFDPVLSEDGSRVAVGYNGDVWLYSVGREARVRLTFGEGGEYPDIWIPGTNLLIYTQLGGSGRGDIEVVDTDDATRTYDLIATTTPEFGPDLTPDRKHLVYYEIQQETNRDIVYVPVEIENGRIVTKGEPQPLVKTPFDEAMPAVSPDGRFVAYHANRTGRWEIYLTRFPDGRREWPVSGEGGTIAHWNPKGGEIFYVDTSGNLVSVPVDTSGEQPVIGEASVLFNGAPFGHSFTSGFHNGYYGVDPSGDEFIVVGFEDAEGTTALTVVENWYSEFEEK